MKKRWLISFLLSILFLCSCSDYHEINDTAMVAGIGIDRGQNAEYRVSVEIVQPASGENAPSSKVISAEGDNVEDCLKHLVNVANKELHFSHCKLIVFSEDITKNGISFLIDSFLRDPQYRADLYLAVVSGKQASEMLGKGEEEKCIVSFEYASVIENSYTETGSVPPTQLYQFFMDGKETLLPIFEETNGRYSLSGTMGFLDGEEFCRLNLSVTQSIMLVSNEFRRGALLLVAEDGIAIPCQICSVKTERKILDGEAITVKAHIQCDIRLTSLPEGFDFSTREGVKKAEETIALLMSQKIKNDWDTTVKDGVDEIFGLQIYLYRHAPSLFDSVENGQRGEMIVLDPQCTVHLENFGFTDERISQ